MTALYSWCRRWISLLIVIAVLAVVSIDMPHIYGPPIRADGEGYHLWTRALLEGDLTFRHYKDWSGMSLADANRQIYQNKYPPGLALLRFPVMMFLVDREPGGQVISPAEHWANQILGGVALALVGFFFLRTCQLLELPNWCGHVGLLALVFGSGLFHYATFDASFSHVYSALGAALLTWLAVRAVVNPPHRLPVLLTIETCFLFILIRNTNILMFGALVVAYFYALRHRGVLTRRGGLRDLAVLLIGTAAGIAVQLSYNYYAQGRLTLSSYGSEPFEWHRPMLRSVLFSYDRGLFNYYPVVAVMLAAAWAVRRTRLAAAAFTLLILTYATLYGFWWSWKLGAGFGHRGFVELMPVAGVLFVAALATMNARGRAIIVAGAAVCTLLTINFMIGIWTYSLPMDQTDPTTYWAFVYGEESVWITAWKHLVH